MNLRPENKCIFQYQSAAYIAYDAVSELIENRTKVAIIHLTRDTVDGVCWRLTSSETNGAIWEFINDNSK
jgi:hypothetical protein